jgi:hypothetical protein
MHYMDVWDSRGLELYIGIRDEGYFAKCCDIYQ